MKLVRSLLPEEFGTKQDRQMLGLIALVALVYFISPMIHQWKSGALFSWEWKPEGLVVAIASLVVQRITPTLIRPITVLWFGIGGILHHITSPIILGLMFYGLVTPMGLIRRLSGKASKTAPNSNWVIRNPPGPAPQSLRKQY